MTDCNKTQTDGQTGWWRDGSRDQLLHAVMSHSLLFYSILLLLDYGIIIMIGIGMCDRQETIERITDRFTHSMLCVVFNTYSIQTCVSLYISTSACAAVCCCCSSCYSCYSWTSNELLVGVVSCCSRFYGWFLKNLIKRSPERHCNKHVSKGTTGQIGMKRETDGHRIASQAVTHEDQVVSRICIQFPHSLVARQRPIKRLAWDQLVLDTSTDRAEGQPPSTINHHQPLTVKETLNFSL